MVRVNSVRVIILLLTCLMTSSTNAGEKLLIVGEEFPPYNFIENGQITGIDVDVATAVFSRLNVDFEFYICPWKRCWAMLKSGKADVGLQVSKKNNRWFHVYFPDTPVWHADFYFLTNQQTKARYDIRRFEDVKKHQLTVGIINGNSYHETFWDAFPFQDQKKRRYHQQLYSVTTAEQLLKMLSSGRIDVFPIVKTIGLYTTKKLKLPNITYYDFVLFSKPYPNVFSRNSTFKTEQYPSILSLLHAYDKELIRFKQTPEFSDIIKKYEQP